jgi:hypothetical protein
MSSNGVNPAGYLEVLWATRDFTRGDFCHTIGTGVAIHLEVPPRLRRSGYAQAGVKVSQHTQPPF